MKRKQVERNNSRKLTHQEKRHEKINYMPFDYCFRGHANFFCPSLGAARKGSGSAKQWRHCLEEDARCSQQHPQDLLDKADCVVVFPSVLKAAFIVGGSYRRGAMSCRHGQDFRGRRTTMMALEGGSFIPNRGRGNGFCSPDHERARCERNHQ